MERLWQNPLFYAGIVILLLGIGNCLVSWSRMNQYSSRLTREAPATSGPLLSDFPELTPQTSVPLVNHLRRDRKDVLLASAKFDFYSVVYQGGRIMAVAGALLIVAVLAWTARTTQRSAAVP